MRMVDMWELVSSDESECNQTYRMVVPGGWLYRVEVWAYRTPAGEESETMTLQSMSTVFVPGI